MDNPRKYYYTAPVVAAALFGVTALWYIALILNLRQISDFAGLRFFWTAALGIAPFIGLALSALLADYQAHTNHPQRRLVLAALTAGLSPWLWLALTTLLRIN